MKKEDYKHFFRSSKGMFLALDKNLRVLDASEGYLAAAVVTRADISGSGIHLVFPFDSQGAQCSRMVKSVKSIFARKPRPLSSKAGAKGTTGRCNGWEYRNVPVLDGTGVVTFVIQELTPLEEKATIEKLQRTVLELRRSNEELAMFAMTASHDIKAPFRTVGNYLSIVEDRLRQRELLDPFGSYFEKIHNARERINTLLDDLLQYSMLSGIDQAPIKINLNKVVKDAMDNLEGMIKDRNAGITIKAPLPDISGTYIQMVQLFQNLLSNAIKFNAGTPVIEISYKNHVDSVEFSIKDNGLGIDGKYFSKVFDVFSRLYSQSKFPGTGLGLAICRKIVSQHGGRIWVESSSKKGTTFHFTVLKRP